MSSPAEKKKDKSPILDSTVAEHTPEYMLANDHFESKIELDDASASNLEQRLVRPCTSVQGTTREAPINQKKNSKACEQLPLSKEILRRIFIFLLRQASGDIGNFEKELEISPFAGENDDVDDDSPQESRNNTTTENKSQDNIFPASRKIRYNKFYNSLAPCLFVCRAWYTVAVSLIHQQPILVSVISLHCWLSCLERTANAYKETGSIGATIATNCSARPGHVGFRCLTTLLFNYSECITTLYAQYRLPLEGSERALSYHLSDATLNRITNALHVIQPKITRIDLTNCSLVSNTSLITFLTTLSPHLVYVKLINCKCLQSNAIEIISCVAPNIRELSIRGCNKVEDRAVCRLINALGRQITRLDVSGCIKVTLRSLSKINCGQLSREHKLKSQFERFQTAGQYCEALRRRTLYERQLYCKYIANNSWLDYGLKNCAGLPPIVRYLAHSHFNLEEAPEIKQSHGIVLAALPSNTRVAGISVLSKIIDHCTLSLSADTISPLCSINQWDVYLGNKNSISRIDELTLLNDICVTYKHLHSKVYKKLVSSNSDRVANFIESFCTLYDQNNGNKGKRIQLTITENSNENFTSLDQIKVMQSLIAGSLASSIFYSIMHPITIMSLLGAPITSQINEQYKKKLTKRLFERAKAIEFNALSRLESDLRHDFHHSSSKLNELSICCVRIKRQSSLLEFLRDTFKRHQLLRSLEFSVPQATAQYKHHENDFAFNLFPLFTHLTDLRIRGAENLSDKGLELISKHCFKLTRLELYGAVAMTHVSYIPIVKNLHNLLHLSIHGAHKLHDAAVANICESICASHIEHIELNGSKELTDEVMYSISALSLTSPCKLESRFPRLRHLIITKSPMITYRGVLATIFSLNSEYTSLEYLNVTGAREGVAFPCILPLLPSADFMNHVKRAVTIALQSRNHNNNNNNNNSNMNIYMNTAPFRVQVPQELISDTVARYQAISPKIIWISERLPLGLLSFEGESCHVGSGGSPVAWHMGHQQLRNHCKMRRDDMDRMMYEHRRVPIPIRVHPCIAQRQTQPSVSGYRFLPSYVPGQLLAFRNIEGALDNILD